MWHQYKEERMNACWSTHTPALSQPCTRKNTTALMFSPDKQFHHSWLFAPSLSPPSALLDFFLYVSCFIFVVTSHFVLLFTCNLLHHRGSVWMLLCCWLVCIFVCEQDYTKTIKINFHETCWKDALYMYVREKPIQFARRFLKFSQFLCEKCMDVDEKNPLY